MSRNVNQYISLPFLLQIEHHPRIAKYAMENHSLREENRKLRLLDHVKRAEEIDAQTIAILEKTFAEMSDKEKNEKSKKSLYVYKGKSPLQ